jgi:hypothetical protein
MLCAAQGVRVKGFDNDDDDNLFYYILKTE